VSGVTTSFLWFAVTFWLYLETRSVVITAVVGAAFSLSSALLGPAFGTYVDRHRKHRAMMLSALITAVCFTVACGLFLLVDTADLQRLGSPWFWLFVAVILVGSVAGNLRQIALSTTVTLLIPADRRDRANGLVGTVMGVSFAITSVFSGLVVGRLGLGWALYLSVALTVIGLVHLTTVPIAEPAPAPHDGGSHIDVRGALEAIRAVPGLGMLIVLAAFNNLLGGVFMALMDAYGLELVSVETWGLLWGLISTGFIAGGLIVARVGLGSRPVRFILIGNLANWTVTSLFALRPSVIMLVVGMYVWVVLMPMIEAAEQTVLQRSIPFERQGRVFGFAQMVENAAAPITAIAIGPLAEQVFIPFMTDGAGVDLIGEWFGTGRDRGLGLIFTLAGLVGILVTVLARMTRSYRLLADAEVSAAATAA